MIFSFASGVGAVILNWVLLGEASPLHDYFIWHGAIPNLWGMLNIIPAIVSALIARNSHSGSELLYAFGVFLQWFLIVFLLCTLILKAGVPLGLTTVI
jgi:hypothetical protein